MENVKYIPGDLVKINGVVNVIDGIYSKSFSKDRVIEANALEGADTARHRYDLDFGKVVTIEPIPLTPTILKANGWKMDSFKRDEDDFLFQPCYKRGSILNFDYYSELSIKPVVKETRSFLSAISDIKEIRLRKIEFVHQLQHLLFGLGLPSELKV